MNLDVMLADLKELVECESFSADHEAVARSARVVADLGSRRLGARPETIVVDGVTHLRWTFGAPRVLVVGHHDTVWPIGTLAEHPWSLVDGVARGPGVFDMKAGLVQAFHALAALPSPDGVCLLVTGDEEVGSPSSRALIEESARGCVAAFVLEASGDGGALKTARKGTSNYGLTVHGKAAHAGLEPDKGANATVELAHQILALGVIASSADGGTAPDGLGPTTVTPTVLSGGTTANTVPALASVEVDVRVPTVAAQRRVDELVRALVPRVAGTRLEVSGGRTGHRWRSPPRRTCSGWPAGSRRIWAWSRCGGGRGRRVRRKLHRGDRLPDTRRARRGGRRRARRARARARRRDAGPDEAVGRAGHLGALGEAGE